ncbi:hypothetical protein TS85_10850 [Sphingomonas hengshuiensis]|uniref:histidine kinase n=1 Tax=Sphingomonas hengshuiensis TaxID=1609977 RepID=A0A7U5BFQ7_9SPHN|nr:hypothetical protein TS85_10850 [Sphingomonas hengshuiensis]
MAAGFVAIASVSSMSALLGWIFDVPSLREYGFDGRPIWPWTAIGYSTLALAFLAAILRRQILATMLWSIPLSLGILSAIQTLGGIDLGIDQWLFGDMVRAYPVPHPGRPGTNPTTILLLLSLAGFAAMTRQPRDSDVRGLVATATLGLAGTVALLLLFSLRTYGAAEHHPPAPSSFVTIFALASAFIVINSDFSWVGLLSLGHKDRRMLRIMLPAVLLMPVVPSLIEALLMRAELMDEVSRELVVAVLNVLIVGMVLYWAVTRIAKGQSALIELSEAMEHATVAMTTTDGRITHWSRGCEALYGWSSEEALGRNKYALLNARCEDVQHGLPKRPIAGPLQLVERRRDGREIWVIEHSHVVSTPDRAPAIVLSINDVTQRVAAVRALSESEERLAMAVAAHQLGIFEWEVTSGRLEWSPGTEQRLGLEPGSINSFETWRAQVEPEDVQSLLETVARAVQNRADSFSWRYRFTQSRTGVRTVEGSSRAFYDIDGNLIRTVGIILDVTEQHEREAALRRREAQLRSILQTVPDAMIVVDEQATILQFSTAAEAVWGYRAPDVLGQRATMLIPAEERETRLVEFNTFLARGDSTVGDLITATAEAANGHRFPVEMRTGVARVDGKLLITIFVRDLSQQLATEERLSELSAEIAHVSRQSAMSELAADLAHELNQPLSATSNFLAAARILLERGEAVERVTDLLRMGSEQTQRAGEIIRRMRAFMARGEVEIRAESLERTVRDAVELVMVGTGQLQIRVAYTFDPDIRHVFADRIQVQQVLVNLMRNSMEALRHAPRAERLITIATRKLDDALAEVEVSDNGPGIPAKVLDQLFSRFTTTKGPSGGMGIGLSISKRIIEAHGGTLSAENRPEGGASFRFTLPLVEEDE